MNTDSVKRCVAYRGAILTSLLLAACDAAPPMALGQLESERMELIAEFAEPLRSIHVTEGDEVEAETTLIEQDIQRIDLMIAEADASIGAIRALLAEQLSGPRPETIDAMRARLLSNEVELAFAEQEQQRLIGLRSRDLTSRESLAQANRAVDSAAALLAISKAQLAELLAGTREEQITRTREQLAQLSRQRDLHMLTRSRHSINSAVAGRIDSLPFEIGEIPNPGDVVAVVLLGEQPLARVYIPEPQRVRLQVGDSITVHIDGLAAATPGRVRRISNEPSFTPYFALSERDRSRLSYVAEIELQYSGDRLPDGVPVQVLFPDEGA